MSKVQDRKTEVEPEASRARLLPGSDVEASNLFSGSDRDIRGRRFSFSMYQLPSTYDESRLGYFLPGFENFARVPEMSCSTIDQVNRKIETQRLIDAIDGRNDWILIELKEFQWEAERMISSANYAHTFGFTAGLFAILTNRICPSHRWVYLPLTVLSAIGAVYYYFFSQKHISQFQVESDKVQLARFPMKKFPPETMVLRKVGNEGKRIRNYLTAACAILYSCYNLLSSHPPCVCGWNILDLLKEQEIAKIREKFSFQNPEKFVQE